MSSQKRQSHVSNINRLRDQLSKLGGERQELFLAEVRKLVDERAAAAKVVPFRREAAR